MLRELVKSILKYERDQNVLSLKLIDTLKRDIRQDVISAFEMSKLLIEQYPQIYYQSSSFVDFLFRICGVSLEENLKDKQFEKDACERKLEACLLEKETLQRELKYEREFLQKELKYDKDICLSDKENLKSQLNNCQFEKENLKSQLNNCQFEKQNLETELNMSQSEKENLKRQLDACRSENLQIYNLNQNNLQRQEEKSWHERLQIEENHMLQWRDTLREYESQLIQLINTMQMSLQEQKQGGLFHENTLPAPSPPLAITSSTPFVSSDDVTEDLQKLQEAFDQFLINYKADQENLQKFLNADRFKDQEKSILITKLENCQKELENCQQEKLMLLNEEKVSLPKNEELLKMNEAIVTQLQQQYELKFGQLLEQIQKAFLPIHQPQEGDAFKNYESDQPLTILPPENCLKELQNTIKQNLIEFMNRNADQFRVDVKLLNSKLARIENRIDSIKPSIIEWMENNLKLSDRAQIETHTASLVDIIQKNTQLQKDLFLEKDVLQEFIQKTMDQFVSEQWVKIEDSMKVNIPKFFNEFENNINKLITNMTKEQGETIKNVLQSKNLRVREGLQEMLDKKLVDVEGKLIEIQSSIEKHEEESLMTKGLNEIKQIMKVMSENILQQMEQSHMQIAHEEQLSECEHKKELLQNELYDIKNAYLKVKDELIQSEINLQNYKEWDQILQAFFTTKFPIEGDNWRQNILSHFETVWKENEYLKTHIQIELNKLMGYFKSTELQNQIVLLPDNFAEGIISVFQGQQISRPHIEELESSVTLPAIEYPLKEDILEEKNVKLEEKNLKLEEKNVKLENDLRECKKHERYLETKLSSLDQDKSLKRKSDFDESEQIITEFHKDIHRLKMEKEICIERLQMLQDELYTLKHSNIATDNLEILSLQKMKDLFFQLYLCHFRLRYDIISGDVFLAQDLVNSVKARLNILKQKVDEKNELYSEILYEYVEYDIQTFSGYTVQFDLNTRDDYLDYIMEETKMYVDNFAKQHKI